MGMLYELCPACGGTGMFKSGEAIRLTQPCPACRALYVTETGATTAQLLAAVERAQTYEDALRAITDAAGVSLAELGDAVQAGREVLAKRGRK